MSASSTSAVQTPSSSTSSISSLSTGSQDSLPIVTIQGTGSLGTGIEVRVEKSNPLVWNWVHRSLAENSAKKGDYEDAKQLSGRITSPDTQAVVRGVIAVEMAKARQLKPALLLAKSLRETCADEDTFSKLIPHLVDGGMFESAIELAVQLNSQTYRPPIFRILAKKIAENGDRHRYRIKHLANVVSKVEKGGASYRLIWVASLLAEGGRIPEALELSEAIGNKEKKETAIKIVIHQLGKRGEKRGLELAQSRPGRRAQIVASHSYIKGLAEGGGYDRAIDLAKQFKSSEDQQNAFGEIWLAMARADKLEAAFKLHKSLKDHSYRFNQSVELACLLAKAKKFDLALTVARKIEYRDAREGALLGIVEHMIEAKQYTDALALRKEVGHSCQYHILQSVAIANTKHGGLDGAYDIVSQLSDLPERKAGTLRDMAVILAKAGNAEDALRVARKIADSKKRNWAYVAVAEELTETRGLRCASKAMHRITKRYPKDCAHEEVAQKLIKQKKYSQARDVGLKLSSKADGARARVFQDLSCALLAEGL